MVTVSQGPIWGMASSGERPPTTTSKSSKLASREPGCARLCELLFGGRDKIGSIVDYLRYMASLAQAENKQTTSRVHRHILLAIHRIRHRSRLDRRTEGCLPKQFTAAGVKGKEISLASAAEQQIRSSR